jgi:4-amino-4-deoxy-L-arabinose transferase-like glycosyltransferase
MPSLAHPQSVSAEQQPLPVRKVRSGWNPSSIALIVFAWIVLQLGGIFSPGLLDDVDSIYIEIAREMLQRRDFVTPYIDGIRFFDKPPLMYWAAAGSMKLFGIHVWAARLPLALAVLALLLSVYALGNRLFQNDSLGEASDRPALYASIALATSIGPYLYTRFFIPDIVITLWMTLAVDLFLVALERVQQNSPPQGVRVPHPSQSHRDGRDLNSPARHSAAPTSETSHRRSQPASALFPCVAFAAVMALNVLTKGFIGLVFPIGFVLLYLAITRQIRLLTRFHPIASAAVFLVIAAPWHILIWLRNPAIALPSGLGLPTRGGWPWFYLYNEHIARFLSKRIPHDYGQVPIPLFWLLAALWLFPWIAFVPAAVARHIRVLRAEGLRLPNASREHEAALTLLLWPALILGFFTLSARQEYYSLPALPALALLAGGLLAIADGFRSQDARASRSALVWHRWMLVPVCSLCAAIALFFVITAPRAAPGADIATLLTPASGVYDLSLSHLADLTGTAMGLFRGPLLAVVVAMLAIGPLSYLLRRRGSTYAANLTLASAAIALLLCVHEGLEGFYPTLGSLPLAKAILAAQSTESSQANDLILIDGELTVGSSLIFYTRQPAHVVNGHINGPWYGSFWPDSPAIFENDETLRELWSGPRRIFLLTYHPAARIAYLEPFGQVHTLAAAGGKSILTNRP